MRHSILCAALLFIIATSAAALASPQELAQEQPKQAVPALDPGEQDGFQFVVRQRAFPLGYVPAGVDVRALRRIENMERTRHPEERAGILSAASIGGNWAPVGPTPVLANFATADLPPGGTNYFGGSIWALAVDPDNKDNVYLGGVGGGVWKTTDSGTHWIPLTDSLPWLSIGSLAIDPSNTHNVYAGTGGPFQLYGEGLLKSTDAGATWSYISTPFSAPSGSDNFFGGGGRILALSVNPSNSSILLAAVWEWGTGRGGIFRSTDGGNTWTQALSGGQGSMVFYYPSNGNVAYASLGDYYGSTADGVYKSLDGGATWQKANGTGTNVLPSSNVGNIILTPALSNPSIMYASVFQSGGSNFLGFFKTTDGGQNWVQPSTLLDLPKDPPQTMTVSPVNPSIVFTGSHDYINRSIDGGVTWVRAIPARFTDNRYFIFSADGSRLYIGDDAGAYSTDDPTGTFQMTNLNRTLPLVLFYPGMSIHPTDPSVVFGGAQDLGINQYAGSPTWNWVYNCDGGATAIDPVTTGNIYATCESGAPAIIIKSTSGGAINSWVAAQSGVSATDNPIFIPPLTMDPSNPQRLYYGATHVYQTNNDAGSWQAISPALTTDTSGFSSVSTIAVAPSNASYVYAGTADGSVYVTQNATLGTLSSWTKITTGLPKRAVTAITVDPATPTTAYVLFSGFSGFGDSKGHIFKTINAGALWQDISGSLPNIPLNDCVVDPDITETLYVGSDMAAFVSTDDGTTWNVLGNGLPRVIIHSLKLHRPTRTLRAATFGRGMWDIQVPLPGTSAANLHIALSHTSSFNPAHNGAYQIAVANQAGAGSTTGLVTVAETLPYGLTLGTMAGTGWSCSISSCARSDQLNAGSSYPAITVTVGVASNAPTFVSNQATVSGGGSPPITAADLTAIVSPLCDVNSDGVEDVNDVQAIVNEALGRVQAVHDLDLNGTVGVADMQMVINAVIGLGCEAK